MNPLTTTYHVSDFEVEVEPMDECLGARVTTSIQTYRVKFAAETLEPCSGRYHSALAIAAPVVPEKVYAAMLNAVTQHQGGNRKATRNRLKAAQ